MVEIELLQVLREISQELKHIADSLEKLEPETAAKKHLRDVFAKTPKFEDYKREVLKYEGLQDMSG